MTNHKTMKRVLIAGAICLVAVASLAISGRGSRPLQDPARQQRSSDDSLALRKAVMQEGLRGAARLRGNYVEELNPHWDWGKFDVEGLTKGSAAVIVGRFTRKLDAHLKGSWVIYTDYEVSVEEIVKGDLKKGATTVVSLPGGRVTFEDGASAEQTTPAFEHPQIGRAYTLFLTQEAAVPSVFFLSGGPQGMFDIEDSAGGVKSHGRPDDQTVVETKGKSRGAFMNDVREKARKWPKPGKCCSE
jgi:hypothetical protein